MLLAGCSISLASGGYLSMAEKAIQSAILIAVSSLPDILVWRNNTGSTKIPNGQWIKFGLVGSPDILGCYRGRFIGIEVKTPTGKQSDAQRNFQRALEKAGGVYVLARSVDDALNALGAIQ